jgi:hypothetical protein
VREAVYIDRPCAKATDSDRPVWQNVRWSLITSGGVTYYATPDGEALLGNLLRLKTSSSHNKEADDDCRAEDLYGINANVGLRAKTRMSERLCFYRINAKARFAVIVYTLAFIATSYRNAFPRQLALIYLKQNSSRALAPLFCTRPLYRQCIPLPPFILN